jgi:hypothetical protein
MDRLRAHHVSVVQADGTAATATGESFAAWFAALGNAVSVFSALPRFVHVRARRGGFFSGCTVNKLQDSDGY